MLKKKKFINLSLLRWPSGRVYVGATLLIVLVVVVLGVAVSVASKPSLPTNHGKALIVCHPGKLETDLSGHFLGDLFKRIENQFFQEKTTFDYYTVDVRPLPNTETRKNHFQADVWSEKFIGAHRKKYHMVFMPDCGGPWYTDVFEKGASFEGTLDKLIHKTLQLVSEDGILFVSKLRDPHYKYLEKKYGKNRQFDVVHKENYMIFQASDRQDFS